MGEAKRRKMAGNVVDIRVAMKPDVRVKDLNPAGGEAKFFQVTRGTLTSPRLATAAEIDEFLDACGMPVGSGNALLAKTGVPFNIDGSTVVLKAVNQED